MLGHFKRTSDITTTQQQIMDGSSDILALSDLITGYQSAYDEEMLDEQQNQNQLSKLTPSTLGVSGHAPEGEQAPLNH